MMTESRFRPGAVLLAVAFLLIPSVAFAQSSPPAVTAEGALAIEKGLAAWLGDRVGGHAAVRALALEGAIIVEPTGDRYRATIPAGHVVVEASGESIAFGAMAIALAPTGDGALAASWVLPSRYEIRGVNGAAPLVITIGGQSGQGVFVPDLGTFLDLALVLSDVTGTIAGQAGAFSVASVGFSVGSENDGPGYFESRGGMVISDLRVAGAGGAGGLSIENLRFDSVLTGLRLAGFMALAESFLSSGGSLASAGPLTTFYDVADKMVRSGDPVASGGAMSFTIENLAVDAAGSKFSLDDMNISAALDGVGEDSAVAYVGLELAGLATNWIPPELNGIVPGAVTIDLDMVELPNGALRRTLLSFIHTSRNMGPYIAARLTPLELKSAFMQSDAKVAVNELRLVAELVDVLVRGSVRTAPRLPLGLEVSAYVEVVGLPVLIEVISVRSQNPRTIEFLTLIQAIGQQAMTDDGRDVRTYEVELGGDLSLVVNGTEIRPLLAAILTR
jgi:hypothetical protein